MSADTEKIYTEDEAQDMATSVSNVLGWAYQYLYTHHPVRLVDEYINEVNHSEPYDCWSEHFGIPCKDNPKFMSRLDEEKLEEDFQMYVEGRGYMPGEEGDPNVVGITLYISRETDYGQAQARTFLTRLFKAAFDQSDMQDAWSGATQEEAEVYWGSDTTFVDFLDKLYEGQKGPSADNDSELIDDADTIYWELWSEYKGRALRSILREAFKNYL